MPSAGDPTADRDYTDPRLAALYDPLNAWGPGDDFYLGLVSSVSSALDLGCGTGQLLRTAARAGGDRVLVGADRAEPMLAEAVRASAGGVTWLHGDARTVDAGRRFELVTMTGHAFQELLTDDDVWAFLANARRHLEPGGVLAFETRNPAARAWEGWPGRSSRILAPGGEEVTVTLGPVRQRGPDLVELSATFRFTTSGDELVSRGTLRFVEPERLRGLLEDAGFRVEGWYGYWDRSPVTAASPEIVVVATPVG